MLLPTAISTLAFNVYTNIKGFLIMTKRHNKVFPDKSHKYVDKVILSLLILWLFFASYFQMPLDLSWLVTINLVSFFLYGYDKRIATHGILGNLNPSRIPERLLHALTIFGGGLGAYAGMRLFRHKTIKKSFQRYFKLFVLISFFLAYLIWKFRQGHFA